MMDFLMLIDKVIYGLGFLSFFSVITGIGLLEAMVLVSISISITERYKKVKK